MVYYSSSLEWTLHKILVWQALRYFVVAMTPFEVAVAIVMTFGVIGLILLCLKGILMDD